MPRRRGGPASLPRTEELLRAADAARDEYIMKKQEELFKDEGYLLGDKGGAKQDDVTHVRRAALRQAGKSIFDFAPIFNTLTPQQQQQQQHRLGNSSSNTPQLRTTIASLAPPDLAGPESTAGFAPRRPSRERGEASVKLSCRLSAVPQKRASLRKADAERFLRSEELQAGVKEARNSTVSRASGGDLLKYYNSTRGGPLPPVHRPTTPDAVRRIARGCDLGRKPPPPVPDPVDFPRLGKLPVDTAREERAAARTVAQKLHESISTSCQKVQRCRVPNSHRSPPPPPLPLLLRQPPSAGSSALTPTPPPGGHTEHPPPEPPGAARSPRAAGLLECGQAAAHAPLPLFTFTLPVDALDAGRCAPDNENSLTLSSETQVHNKPAAVADVASPLSLNVRDQQNWILSPASSMRSKLGHSTSTSSINYDYPFAQHQGSPKTGKVHPFPTDEPAHREEQRHEDDRQDGARRGSLPHTGLTLVIPSTPPLAVDGAEQVREHLHEHDTPSAKATLQLAVDGADHEHEHDMPVVKASLPVPSPRGGNRRDSTASTWSVHEPPPKAEAEVAKRAPVPPVNVTSVLRELSQELTRCETQGVVVVGSSSLPGEETERERVLRRSRMTTCPMEYGGGDYALAYRRLIFAPGESLAPSSPRSPSATASPKTCWTPYPAFKQSLDARTARQHVRSLQEIERCEHRRRLLFEEKSALLTQLSDPRSPFARRVLNESQASGSQSPREARSFESTTANNNNSNNNKSGDLEAASEFNEDASCDRRLDYSAAGSPPGRRQESNASRSRSYDADETRATKTVTWQRISQHVQKLLHQSAVSRDAADRWSRREMFLQSARQIAQAFYPHVPDCLLFLDRLHSLFASDDRLLTPKHFMALVATFEASHLLQDDFCEFVDFLRPVFGMSQAAWHELLSERLRSFERRNMEGLLERQNATSEKLRAKITQDTTAAVAPKMSVRIHAVKGALPRDHATCLAVIAIRPNTDADGEAGAQVKTSVKKSNRPVWNEDFVLTVHDEHTAVIDFVLYDLSELRSGPIGTTTMTLGKDTFPKPLQRGVRTRVELKMKPNNEPQAIVSYVGELDAPVAVRRKLSNGSDTLANHFPAGLGQVNNTMVVRELPSEMRLVLTVEPLNFGLPPPPAAAKKLPRRRGRAHVAADGSTDTSLED
eukprot:gene14202-21776_t